MTDLFPRTLEIYQTFDGNARGQEWIARLPALVEKYRDQWSLRLGQPYAGGSCSWVAQATRANGSSAVLKITWPHREANSEAEGLRRCAGRGAATLFEAAPEDSAFLLERVEPGAKMDDAHETPPETRLLTAARLLSELWSAPLPTDGETTTIETLDAIMDYWADEAQERADRLDTSYDPGVIALGIETLRSHASTASRRVLLHGDFNPGNILTSTRASWLAIDTKPMIGDPCYDPWPLVEQVDDPFVSGDPALIRHRFQVVGDALGLDVHRMLAWGVGRKTEYALTCADEGDPMDGARHASDAALLARMAY